MRLESDSRVRVTREGLPSSDLILPRMKKGGPVFPVARTCQSLYGEMSVEKSQRGSLLPYFRSSCLFLLI
jgi:hypothetical protein